ncbi:MAG: DMT family transporter [Colwellia sp.]|nr:DMT family transporter [Colwellia sp.]
MTVRLTYLLVIFIWTTTPLAIKLGGDTLDPMAGLSLRIAIAFLVGSTICTIAGISVLNIKRNGILYFAGSLGLFPNMALVYFSAEYISSGLIALMFGLLPFFTAILSKPILGKSSLLPRKVIAIILAIAGLLFIFYDDEILKDNAYIGLLLMLGSNLIFAACTLWMKKINKILNVPPFEQTLGAMAFSLPGMLITWFFVVGYEPLQFSSVSIASLLYLSLFASLVGFAAYYHILNNMSVDTVALIPLITPITAMVLGVIVADETITRAMYVGAAFILIALIIHQGFLYKIFKIIR